MGLLKIGAIVGAIIGLVLVLLASILGWVVLPKVIDDKIKEEVRLIEGSETWDKWADITLPIQFKFYIFHVTNPDDVEKGFAPILEEKGPYVYDEKRKKEDLEVDGDIISYRQPIVYQFNPEASFPLRENDTVNIINIPYLSVLHVLRENPLIANVLNTYLRIAGERVIRKNVEVGDLTFDHSGVLLNANKRLQVNMHLEPMAVEGFRFVKNMYFPLVWVDESAGVDEESAQELKDKLLKPMKIIDVAKWTALGVGIVLTIVGAILAWKA